MWRGSRHIILVERGRSAPQASIIYGISSGGWRRHMMAQTLLGGGLPSHRAAHTQLVRAGCVRYRTHSHRTAIGAAAIARARGRKSRVRARRSRQADGSPRHMALAQAQPSPPLLGGPARWPTRVRQQHAFQSHRLSTAWTDHLPRTTVPGGWC